MTYRTTTDLAERVLQELNVTAFTEAAGHTEVKIVQDRYSDRFAQLVDEDLADWEETDIPPGAMEGLTLLMADICAPAFGLPRDINREALGLRKLAEFSQVRHTGEAVEAVYY